LNGFEVIPFIEESGSEGVTNDVGVDSLKDQPQDLGPFETILISMLLKQEKTLAELRSKIEGYEEHE
jgi:hypothetical protein